MMWPQAARIFKPSETGPNKRWRCDGRKLLDATHQHNTEYCLLLGGIICVCVSESEHVCAPALIKLQS